MGNFIISFLKQFGGRVFVRSENCKYIVDNNDMYNQCKECGSVLAADDGPLGGGGDDFEPDQKYHPATIRAMRAISPKRLQYMCLRRWPFRTPHVREAFKNTTSS